MQHPRVFGPFFRRGSDGLDTWKTWKVFLAAVFGLPMNKEELKVYRRFTGRSNPPAKPFREAHAIVGRRGGKSLQAATIVVHVATFLSYDDVLAPGEVGVACVVAASKRQAQVVLGYVRSYFNEIPMLKAMVVAEDADSLTLSNRIRIEVLSSNPRVLRGHTIICAVLDELAFMGSDDSANSAEEVYKAIKPAMLTVPGALLIGISSPYAKKGFLWNLFRANYGKETGVLVWRAPTLAMNPSVDRAEIEAERQKDPVSAAAEYDAQFRSDLESYVSREVVEACVVAGRKELMPWEGISYRAFVDPSGGASDSMTLCIGHREGGKAVVDYLAEKIAPFNPDDVTDEFCAELKRFGVYQVTGDNYAGEWPKARFRSGGVEYRVAEKHRGDLYLQTLPRLTSKRVELPDNERLISQFCGLERSTAKSGRDAVDHIRGGHDDVANAVAGLVLELLGGAGTARLTLWELKAKIYDTYLATGKTEEEQEQEESNINRPLPVVAQNENTSVVKAREAAKVDVVCPTCGGTTCIVKRGQLYRHNVCGTEWDVPTARNANPPAGQRRDALQDHSVRRKW